MLSRHYIFTVAKYEMLTLSRSWFFRIFAILVLLIVTGFDIAAFTTVGDAPWFIRAIGSGLPYSSMIFLNAGQAVVAVFLASEFLKQDQKNDTVEVIYVRPMTNGDYIIGKSLGILALFMILNLVVLFINAIFSFIHPDLIHDWVAFAVYPILISIPTLVFILGLSYLLMILIKNQAVTFIFLLGYIALSLFYLNQKFYHIFDYITYHVPLFRSGIAGFANTDYLLEHRGMYFFLGLSFIFFSGFKLKRLPQSRKDSILFLSLAIIFFLSATFLSTRVIKHMTLRQEVQQNIHAMNEAYEKHPFLDIKNYKLNINHLGSEIEVTTDIKAKNENQKVIDTIVLTLNPGFRVNEIAVNNNKTDFIQKHQLLLIPHSVEKNEDVFINVKYKGVVDENACYPHLPISDYEMSFQLDIFRAQKRYAFIEPNLVCLTGDVNWYPVSGITYYPNNPVFKNTDFANYTLKVTTSDSLSCISQGQVKVNQNNWEFTNTHDLSNISLNIGKYNKNSITVDSVEFSLYTYPGHNYLRNYTNEIGDTLATVIREIKNEYESKLNRTYPFHKLDFVEVPLQFYAERTVNTISRGFAQPQIMLLPERALTMQNADFNDRLKRTEDRMKDENEVLTEKEKQVRILKYFLERNFAGGDEGWWQFDESIGKNVYSVFPQYFTFVNHIKSEKYPVFNLALEAHLKELVSDPSRNNRNFWEGLSMDERTNLAIEGMSFKEFLLSHERDEIYQNTLQSKGHFLFEIIKIQLGEDGLTELLEKMFEADKFSITELSNFEDIISSSYNYELKPAIDQWYNGKKQPGYLVTGVEGYKVLENDRTYYQVRLSISNPEEVDGAVTINMMLGERESGRRYYYGLDNGDEGYDFAESVFVPAKTTQDIGLVFYEEPQQLLINTRISKNIPSLLSIDFDEFELRRKTHTRDTIVKKLFSEQRPYGEYIVDNEDEGFSFEQSDNDSYLRKWLNINNEEEKYSMIRYWRPPGKWRGVTQTNFYGKYVRSAMYTKSGEGDRLAIWHAPLKDNGTYDVYYHVGKYKNRWRKKEQRSKYNFTIYHAEGQEEMSIDVKDAEEGWNYLGTYFFTEDDARVDLTNEAEGDMVFADAVKWVKQ